MIKIYYELLQRYRSGELTNKQYREWISIIEYIEYRNHCRKQYKQRMPL